MQTMTHTEQRFHGLLTTRRGEIPDPIELVGRHGPAVPFTAEHVQLMRARLIHDDSVRAEPGEDFAGDVYLDAAGRIHVGLIGEKPGMYALTAHRDGGAGWLTITATWNGVQEGQINVLDLDDAAEVAWAASALWDWAFT